MFKNILVNALVNLGDVVLTTSALALLKKNFPDTRITMLVKPVVADAVIDNPVVDDVIVLDYRAKENSFGKMRALVKEIRRREFDLAISFDRKLRPALITFLARIPRRVVPSKKFRTTSTRRYKPRRIKKSFANFLRLTVTRRRSSRKSLRPSPTNYLPACRLPSSKSRCVSRGRSRSRRGAKIISPRSSANCGAVMTRCFLSWARPTTAIMPTKLSKRLAAM